MIGPGRPQAQHPRDLDCDPENPGNPRRKAPSPDADHTARLLGDIQREEPPTGTFRKIHFPLVMIENESGTSSRLSSFI